MRLFAAVRIDPAVARTIAVLIEDLRRRVSSRAPSARVSWVKESQLHITSRFIGHVSDHDVATIRDALSVPLSAAPFEVSAAGTGAFPARGAPRVFWAGVRDGVESLVRIEEEVSRRLEGCGIPREHRPYRPHITLARIRDAAGLRASILEGDADRRFGDWRVDAITLFESRASPQGHQYLPLCETPLQP